MADLTIKLPGGNNTIGAETTEPSKPYLAQKTGDGVLYYPLETYTSGEGVLIKGNNTSYKIREAPPIYLQMDGEEPYLSRLTQILVYDSNGILQKTYNNPSTSKLEVFAGGKIKFIHDSSVVWAYWKIGGTFYNVVYLDSGNPQGYCFVDVPLTANGGATLGFNQYSASTDVLKYNVATEWINSTDCYPYI